MWYDEPDKVEAQFMVCWSTLDEKQKKTFRSLYKKHFFTSTVETIDSFCYMTESERTKLLEKKDASSKVYTILTNWIGERGPDAHKFYYLFMSGFFSEPQSVDFLTSFFKRKDII